MDITVTLELLAWCGVMLASPAIGKLIVDRIY